MFEMCITFERLKTIKFSILYLCNLCLFRCLTAEHLLRTDLVEDKEGFFIALFVRENVDNLGNSTTSRITNKKIVKNIKENKNIKRKAVMIPLMHNRMFRIWSLTHCMLKSGRIFLDAKNDFGDS